MSKSNFVPRQRVSEGHADAVARAEQLVAKVAALTLPTDGANWKGLFEQAVRHRLERDENFGEADLPGFIAKLRAECRGIAATGNAPRSEAVDIFGDDDEPASVNERAGDGASLVARFNEFGEGATHRTSEQEHRQLAEQREQAGRTLVESFGKFAGPDVLEGADKKLADEFASFAA